MTARRRLVLITHGPALVDNDSRALAAVKGLERALPGLRLTWRVTEERQLASVPQRDEWLVEATKDGDFPFLCNGDKSYPVTISGQQTPAGTNPGRQPLLNVHAELPMDGAGLAAATDVLEAVAEGACSYWGHTSPDDYGSEVSQQMRHSAHGPERSPRGLPMLNLPWHIHSPAIPQYLGWLNYWSAASAQAIGFPDPARDADLLTRARRTAVGGWVVRLTDTPLDYDDPTHLDALKRAYERFPEIGGRSTP